MKKLLLTIMGLGFIMSINAQKINIQKTDQSGDLMSYFLKIEGVNGKCIEQNHVNWIKLSNWDFELQKSMTINSQISGINKLNLKVEKQIDDSSNILMDLAQNNTIKTNVIIETTQTNNRNAVTILKIKTNKALIKNIQILTDNFNDLKEIIQFEIENAEVTYYIYDKSGNLMSTKKVEVGGSTI